MNYPYSENRVVIFSARCHHDAPKSAISLLKHRLLKDMAGSRPGAESVQGESSHLPGRHFQKSLHPNEAQLIGSSWRGLCGVSENSRGLSCKGHQ